MAEVPGDRVTAELVHRIVTDVPTHVSLMSRLMTLARPEGLEPPTL